MISVTLEDFNNAGNVNDRTFNTHKIVVETVPDDASIYESDSIWKNHQSMQKWYKMTTSQLLLVIDLNS